MSDTIGTSSGGAGAPLPVHQAPGFALRAAEQLRSAIWRRIVGEFPSTPLFALMLAMRSNPDAYQQAVADRIGIDKATTTSLIQQLERLGLAVRGTDASDGRRRTIYLSGHVDEIIERVFVLAQEVDRELLAPLALGDRSEIAEIWRLTAQAEAGPLANDRPDRLSTFLGSPGWLLRRTRQVHSRLWEFEVRHLTPPQYAALDVLYYQGPLEVLATARQASLEESNGARLLARLANRGCIARSADPMDGRRIVLGISDAGVRVLRLSTPGVRRVQAQLMTPLRTELVERFHVLTARVARIDRTGFAAQQK